MADPEWVQDELRVPLDLGPGFLDPALMPTQDLADAAARAFQSHGTRSLSYGANLGPKPLREVVRQRLGLRTVEGVAITAGASHALAWIARSLVPRGAALLVERPTYDLAVKVFKAGGIRIVACQQGSGAAEIRSVIERARRQQIRVTHMYVVPTAHNPTGNTLSLSQREDLLDTAAAQGITIIEDLAYHELWFDHAPPPSLQVLRDGKNDPVILSVGTFSKVLAPGLRVGWISAPDDVIARYASSAVRQSGGGPAHAAASIVAEYCAAGHLDPHLQRLRAELRHRCDELVSGLAPVSVHRPAGGYFIWITLPPGVAGASVVSGCARHGVRVSDGSAFGVPEALRATFVRLSPPELRRAGAILQAEVARQSASSLLR